ncbi:hypothetical protein [Stenotrophomonas sp. NPDC078853]|uniref:hypothetical protein n=1 Tax=Stenotrophomonas sp. NPDC078853 TaxID=3364534 RepID=UPI00384CCAFC
MAIKASAFVVGKDLDVPLGGLLQSEGVWYVRAQIKTGDALLDVAIAISGENLGDTLQLNNAASCVHLAEGLRVEYRVSDIIGGPGKPPNGALAWSVDGKEQAVSFNGSYVTAEGTESKKCSKEHAFYSLNWGAWLVDAEGKDVAREALFFNQIIQAGR